MSKKSEAEILADAYEFSRGLTKYYFSKLDGIDKNQRLETNGVKFNSPHWIAAHLVWTEHFLFIEGLGAPSPFHNGETGGFDIPWLEQYGFGSDPEKITDKPEYD